MTDFERYKKVHLFVHETEISSYLTADNYINRFYDWTYLMEAVNKIETFRVNGKTFELIVCKNPYIKDNYGEICFISKEQSKEKAVFNLIADFTEFLQNTKNKIYFNIPLTNEWE